MKEKLLKKIDEEIEKIKQAREHLKVQRLKAEIEGNKEMKEYFDYGLVELAGKIKGLQVAYLIISDEMD